MDLVIVSEENAVIQEGLGQLLAVLWRAGFESFGSGST